MKRKAREINLAVKAKESARVNEAMNSLSAAGAIIFGGLMISGVLTAIAYGIAGLV